jgi:hypothetical protein
MRFLFALVLLLLALLLVAVLLLVRPAWSATRGDALVYMELIARFLLPSPPPPDDTALRQQGWRSVSFVMPFYSHVVYATEAAPVFLRAYAGQSRQPWENASTFFDL